MVPLFYFPVLSRAVGHPVYGWIASHRHVISTCVVAPEDPRPAACAPDPTPEARGTR
jgi:hypothetical protein